MNLINKDMDPQKAAAILQLIKAAIVFVLIWGAVFSTGFYK